VKFQSCFRKLNSLEVPHVVVSSSLLRGLRGQGFGVRRIEQTDIVDREQKTRSDAV
jgi:hypothetical protein